MERVLPYVEANTQRYLEELGRLLAIPSVSTDPDRAADVRGAAEWLLDHMRSVGLEHGEIFPTAGHPIVYADWLHAAGAPTVLLYGHYDVQPVEPLELWTSPPFEATVRDGRLYGRGASDDKGQVLVHVRAAAAWLATERRLPVNLKFLIEGEEEISSPHLAPFIRAHTDLLRCGAVVISDTGMYADGWPTITYGTRGLLYKEIRLFGPKHNLHSGSFGGSLDNSQTRLAVYRDVLNRAMAAAFPDPGGDYHFLHRAFGRHSVSGLRTTVVSIIEKGAGSVALSARPALPKTRSTSGNDFRIRSCT